MRLHGRDDAVHVGGIEREGDGEEGSALQFDPSLPALARLGEDRPGDADLLAEAIDVGADGRDTVMLCRLEREIHARRDVPGGPVRLAVLADILQRAGEGAVRVGAARPDMALVQMRVGLDEGGEEDATVEVDHLRGRTGGCGSRFDRSDPAPFDRDVDQREFVVMRTRPSPLRGGSRAQRGGRGLLGDGRLAPCDPFPSRLRRSTLPARGRDEAPRHARVADQEVRHHRSFFMALSCQSFSSRCDTNTMA